MQITYGDPTVRMPHINRPVYNWKIDLYIIRKLFLNLCVYFIVYTHAFTFLFSLSYILYAISYH